MTADDDKTKTDVQLGIMQAELFRIGAMINTFPSTYVTQTEYKPWRDSVEKRFDDVNKEFDDIDRLKSEGGKWAIEERSRTQSMISESERHLQEKLEKSIDQVEAMHEKLLEKLDVKIQQQDAKHDSANSATWSWRQMWLSAAFAGVLVVIQIITTYAMSHH